MHGSETEFGPPFGDFQEALLFLEGIPNYEKTTDWDYTPKKLNLFRVSALMDYLGRPQDAFKTIHVAGTKGKGSTAAILASCLQAAGYRTGLYTSPHLVSPIERAKVDGEKISQEDFARLLGKLKNYIRAGRESGEGMAPTYFETLTALAFDYFRERSVEWAVVEVGLGGRLDSTNIVQPECCVITPIGFDHTDKLGSDIASIATEKAGILKEGVPVIVGCQPYPDAVHTVRKKADELGCECYEFGQDIEIRNDRAGVETGSGPGWRFGVKTPWREYGDLFTPLLGAHQMINCATAAGVLSCLAERGDVEITLQQIRRGMAGVDCPARVQLLQQVPPVILDTAHTVESVNGLLDALGVHFPYKKVNFVFGCSSGKNVEGMLSLLPQGGSFTATSADSPRAVPAEEVARIARKVGLNQVKAVTPVFSAVKNTLKRTMADELLCVTGSFYVAGEVLQQWK